MSTSPTAVGEPRGEQKAIWRRFGIAPIYVVVILLFIAIGLLNPQFLEPAGFLNLFRRAAPLIVVTVGELFVIVGGGFDLSAGSVVSFTVIASALWLNNDPNNTWWVLLVLLAFGVLVGLVNGFVVTFLKVPSLIATLGMLLLIRGFGLYISGGAPRGYFPDNFRMFGRGFIEAVPFLDRVPYAVLILIGIGLIAGYLFHQTVLGRDFLAIGDNPRASRLSGVRVARVRVLTFVVSAVCAVIGGVLLGGFGGVTIDAGLGLELQAISACVLGGAALLGGKGSVPRAIAGAVALEALFTLLNLLGLPKPLRDAVQGIIIIAAVAYAAIGTRTRK